MSEDTDNDVTMLPHVIITGNPGDGFTMYGPFCDSDAAIAAADEDGDLDGDWWVMPIHPHDAADIVIERKQADGYGTRNEEEGA